MRFAPQTASIKKLSLLVLISLSLFFSECNKVDKENYISYKPYFALQPGKFLIYQLDSTITRAFGTSFETHSYIIKDSVIDIIYDNLNRPSLRIFRYVKDTNGEWQSDGNTFMATETDNSLEYVENNLRYIKMINPVSINTNWDGNSYINTSPFPFDGSFSTWQYSYSDINVSKTLDGITYPNTVTVVQYDSTQNKPFYALGYNTYQSGYEIYADSVGMVYKEITDWEYQQLTSVAGCRYINPNSNGSNDTIPVDCEHNEQECDSIASLPGTRLIDCDTTLVSGYYDGFGIRQVLLSHN